MTTNPKAADETAGSSAQPSGTPAAAAIAQARRMRDALEDDAVREALRLRQLDRPARTK